MGKPSRRIDDLALSVVGSLLSSQRTPECPPGVQMLVVGAAAATVSEGCGLVDLRVNQPVDA
jgi:hypothetical protein